MRSVMVNDAPYCDVIWTSTNRKNSTTLVNGYESKDSNNRIATKGTLFLSNTGFTGTDLMNAASVGSALQLCQSCNALLRETSDNCLEDQI